jgi:hypothetical protein
LERYFPVEGVTGASLIVGVTSFSSVSIALTVTLERYFPSGFMV